MTLLKEHLIPDTSTLYEPDAVFSPFLWCARNMVLIARIPSLSLLPLLASSFVFFCFRSISSSLFFVFPIDMSPSYVCVLLLSDRRWIVNANE